MPRGSTQPSRGPTTSCCAGLIAAATRHNERNPDRAVLVLNHSSIDPDLTGKSCSFWHFQFEANTAMKMKALANFVKRQSDVKSVYLFNQDYAHGKQWARYGQELVGLARPDVKFVGSDLHPIGHLQALSKTKLHALRLKWVTPKSYVGFLAALTPPWCWRLLLMR